MISRDELKVIREEIIQALKVVGESHGLEFSADKITYSDLGFTAKLEAKQLIVNGKPHEQAEFEKLCFLYGFKKEDYQRAFTVQNRVFELVAFNTKARDKACIARSDGRLYIFAPEVVKRRMEA